MPKGRGKVGEATISALASDDLPRYLKLDTSTASIQTIDYPHHEVHAGSHFFYTDYSTLAATTDTNCADYVITTPNTTKWAHMLIRATGSAITEVMIYEGTDITGSSDAETVFNNNRNSDTLATVTINKSTATSIAASTGTKIWSQKSGGATQQSRSSMDSGNVEELILKQNTKYLLRLVSSTASNLCNVKLEWYEHVNKS